jgi:hypothetical protein
MNEIEVAAGFHVAEVYGRVLDRTPPLGSLAELRGWPRPVETPIRHGLTET